jgi:hypothetical protein
MTTALKNADTIDMKHLAIQVQQLKNNAGSPVDVSDIVAGIAAGQFPDINAGASGTAGSVNVFPTTASKGKTKFTAADNTGNTTTTISTALQATTRAYTIPDAGADASFRMTEGPAVTRRTPVAATGTNLATAAQLSSGFTTVTGADDTVGVKLPAAPAAGTVCIVKSTVSNKILKVYPDASATINAIGSNGAISLASGATIAMFIADSTTQWYTLPLLPS